MEVKFLLRNAGKLHVDYTVHVFMAAVTSDVTRFVIVCRGVCRLCDQEKSKASR
jgi:hypothetical protein